MGAKAFKNLIFQLITGKIKNATLEGTTPLFD